jgi:hypothetical protein
MKVKTETIFIDYPFPVNKLRAEGWKEVRRINGIVIMMRITYEPA